MLDTIVLERWADHDEHGVFGEMYHEGKWLCKTVERPWQDNKPFVSCVPARVYDLEPFTRSNGDEVYCLIDERAGVVRTEAELPASGGRYAVLIHKGNWMTDLAGCIAPGEDYSYGPDSHDGTRRLMVTNSAKATRDLFDYIKAHHIRRLAIVWKKH